MVAGKVLVFPELCHSCGGCQVVCPENAVIDGQRELGVVEWGVGTGVPMVQGRIRVGEAMSPPLIRKVRDGVNGAAADGLVIIDAPPGTSCPVIAAMRVTDFVLLVTEPPPFGLHDLKLAVDTVRELRLPFGVVINRVGIGDDRVQRFCSEASIPLLLEIPDDRRIAEAYSRGELIVEALPEYRAHFGRLWQAMTLHAGARS